MKQQNKWEKLFDKFLDLTEFTLVKHQNDWSLIDNQGGNICNIEGDRFKSASEIFLRMDSYIDDYIVNSIEEHADLTGIDVTDWDNWGWDYLLTYRNRFPIWCRWDFDVLDMICNHDEEINLENCTYKEKC